MASAGGADRLLIRIDGNFTGLRNALNGASQAVATNSTKINNTLRAANTNFTQVGNTARNSGMMIQQAGFQIGDFAVQVASGQGALRAFIQQGTQLVSMFGPGGAIIGAIGAVIGAIITFAMRSDDAADSTDTLKEAQDRLKVALGAVGDEIKLNTGLMGKYLGLAGEAVNARLVNEGERVRGLRADLQKILDEEGDATQILMGSESEPFDIRKTPRVMALQAEIDKGQQLIDELARQSIRYARLSAPGVEEGASTLGAAGKSSTGKKTEEIKEQESALRELIGQQQIELRLISLSARERAIEEASIRAAEAAMRDYDAGLRDSPLLYQAEIDAIRAKAAAIYDATEAQRKAKEEMKDAAKAEREHAKAVGEMADDFGRMGRAAALAGNSIEKWADVLLDNLDEIANAIIEILALQNTGGESGLGGLFASIATAIGGAFAGSPGASAAGLGINPGVIQLAGGGGASRGRAQIVGERGWEFFQPHSDGTIYNQQQLRGIFSRGGREAGPQFFINMPGATLEAVLRLESVIRAVNGSIEERAINAMVNQRYRGGANAQPFR